jgi:hypothetical protein
MQDASFVEERGRRVARPTKVKHTSQRKEADDGNAHTSPGADGRSESKAVHLPSQGTMGEMKKTEEGKEAEQSDQLDMETDREGLQAGLSEESEEMDLERDLQEGGQDMNEMILGETIGQVLSAEDLEEEKMILAVIGLTDTEESVEEEEGKPPDPVQDGRLNATGRAKDPVSDQGSSAADVLNEETKIEEASK